MRLAQTHAAVDKERIVSLAGSLRHRFSRGKHELIAVAYDEIDSNIRELEGALYKVIFYCELKRVTADSIEVIREALHDEINEVKALNYSGAPLYPP